MDNRGSESPPRGHSAPNLNNNTLLLTNSASMESPYMDNPEALIAGLQKNNNAGNGESGGGDGVGKKKKKKAKKSNIYGRAND